MQGWLDPSVQKEKAAIRLPVRGPSWDQGRASRNCPVGNFSEGAGLQGWLDPSVQKEKAAIRLPVRGPSWDRTSDPLIMSQML